MLASWCLKHVSTDQRIAYTTAIHFWLLFTQAMSGNVATVRNNISNTSNSLPQPSGFVLRQQALLSPSTSSHPMLPPTMLMDKALTNCGSANSSRWRPICATVNNVDYVLFGSECLLEQTNRERQRLDTGDAARPVFRKIAMGFCRPSCSVVICEGSEQPICVRNVQNDEVRSFSGHGDMARDVCIYDNDWQPIPSDICFKKHTNSDPMPTITTSHVESTSIIATAQKVSLLNPTHKICPKKLLTKQIKKIHGKSIPCPKVFNPVCAELFGVKATFINECLVNAENVNFGKTWQVFSTGVCAEDYASSETRKYDKTVINKRSTPVSSATVTYNLDAPELRMKDDVLWTSNIENTNYMNNDVFSAYGGQMRSMLQYNQPYSAMYCSESSLDIMPHNIRILPAVDDRVSECKFGAGPVCGRSAKYKTYKFKNICDLLLRNVILNESWTVVNDGYCRKCILNCTTDYDPFCVSRNGVNYTIINQCHLNYALCRSKVNELKILGKGECAEMLKNHTQNGYQQPTTPSPTQKGAYLPRHARKIFDIILNQGDESVLNDSLAAVRLTENPVEIIFKQTKTSPKVFTENTTVMNPSVISQTTTSSEIHETQSESHIMDLRRSSKAKSRFSRRKTN